MTTIADFYTAIRQRIEGAWPAIEPSVPLAWPREDFERSPDGTPFLLVEITWSGGEGITIGAPGDNVARRYGMIWFHAMIPIGTGDVRGMEIAAEAAAIYEDQQFSGVTCQAAEPGGGQSGTDDGLYAGQSIAVPFWADELV